MGTVGKAVVRQGREAHNRVNTCLNYRDPRGRHHQQFRMPEKRADSRKHQTAFGRIQDCESFICNFKIPGHKCFSNSSS